MNPPLRVAVVHYHLRPGGVTTVIRRAVESLAGRAARLAVLVGKAGASDWPVCGVLGLDYTRGAPRVDGTQLAARLRQAARRALGADPDVWHFHNHALGKHPALADAVARLAAEGRRLLLQIHDFAEDGRPANYRRLCGAAGPAGAARAYPSGAHVHYAVLNSRDRACLMAAGLPVGRAHLLPNPVIAETAAAGLSARPGSGRTWLYPTRAIRRKNLGEFLLWAALAPREDRFVVTLAPTQPADRRRYRAWRALARRLRLPVEFEAGLRAEADPRAMMRGAWAVVTTSVAEGFGLAFLEPWLCGRPLVGRDLPEITADMKAMGLEFPALYEQLLVPLRWIGRKELRATLAAAMEQSYAAYGRRLRDADVDAAMAAMIRGARVDFGRLDETRQAAVIARVVASRRARACVAPPALAPEKVSAATIRRNAAAVRRHFSLAHYGDHLWRIYQRLARTEPGALTALDSQLLLDRFLAPERFNLLRT